MKQIFLTVLTSTCILTNIFGQEPLPSFGAPLEIPLFLSGNFAELRNNHFHTGIDIKTQGVVGQQVVSAEEGFVSRISVSPWGYGNALHIQHPNGYTTVYGHMKSFSPEIVKALRGEQYAKESFSVDFTPTDTIYVEKGESIGLSGNTGGSGGPHLHFEIRNTKTGRPQNPLLFGFDITDDIPPKLRGLRVHPMSNETFINGQQNAKSFIVTGTDGNYALKTGTNINIYGPFGFSLHALDYLNGQSNKCGIYSLNLQVDHQDICHQQFDELDFGTVRNINIYKDFEVYKQNKWHYHKSFREPGNQLEIYADSTATGIMSFHEDAKHHAAYTAKDAYGNTSILKFDFTTLANRPAEPKTETYDAYFAWDQANEFEYENEIAISIPKRALYEDLAFQFGREMPNSKTKSAFYSIQATYVPLQKPITITIAWDGSTTEAEKKKILAVRESPSGGKSFVTGDITDIGYTFKSKDFGKFHLSMDTISPTLSAWKWSKGGHLNTKSKLQYKVSDDKSGVKSYVAMLNGEWALLQYDPKKKRLWMDVGESNFKSGSNDLQITITDRCGNSVVENYSYTY